MEWVADNWRGLLEAVLAVLGAASVVAKLTPSKADDKWIGKIINFFGLAKKIK
jgi:hypothetical protein